MPTDEAYRNRINTFNWSDLHILWEDIKKKMTPDWDAGKAFEYLILRAFELEDAQVSYPFRVSLPFVNNSTIEQIDGAIHVQHLSCIIESKDHSSPVNIDVVAKLRNQLTRRPTSTVGIIFSTSGFTDPTVMLTHFTQPQTILLWTGAEVEYALTKQVFVRGLFAKYHYYVEHGLPDYNIEGV